MKKIIFLFIIVCFIITGQNFGQLTDHEKPDFDKIEKSIKDNSSPFFYSTLLKRYNDHDTTLKTEEYRYLYYGFSLQAGYSPYGKSGLNEELKKEMKSGATDKVIELEKKILKEFPFNLRDLYTLSNMLEKKSETAEAERYNKKMIGIAKAILSTGDGGSDSTAMYVISVEHEYDMLGLLGYKMGGGQTLLQGKYGPTDKLKLAKNDDGLEYLYFNVDRLFASMKKMFKEKD